jgi:RNA polymerase sigma factor (sigma-70 family)
MQFTPLTIRAAQVSSAEGVLHDIDPAKAYPMDWLIFRLTGYRPKHPPKDLLTGLALQHDLGLLIEEVSESLDQRVEDVGQPILSLEDATQKFNVTSKTLQRWRRKGLSGRRLIFPDGKKRIGFLLSNLERFLARNGRQVMAAANFSPVDSAEKQEMQVAANRLTQSRCTFSEITRRLGRKFNRSPVMIEQLIQRDIAIAPEFTAEQRSKIYRRWRHGSSLSELARIFEVGKSTLFWAIVDERQARIQLRKTKFIDDPLYHQDDAEQAIATIAACNDFAGCGGALSVDASILQIDHPVLTPAQERALFLKFNFHKYRFVASRRQLEERSVSHRKLCQIEQHLSRATEVRNQIVRANLRLLVSTARRHARGCVGLMDLISDGSITLMRAVESFDFHKGNHFATYATFGLMKEFARSAGRLISKHKQPAGLNSDVADAAASQPSQLLADQDYLARLLRELSESERAVLRLHYGLEGMRATGTYRQTARELGISTQQVRRLEETALSKLRAIANSPT